MAEEGSAPVAAPPVAAPPVEAPPVAAPPVTDASTPPVNGRARGEDGKFVAASSPPDLPPVHWAAGLDADLQNLPRVKEAKTLTEYVQRNREMETYLGRSLQLPQDFDPAKTPDAEKMAGVWKKLGRPEKAEEYTLPEAAASGEAVGWDKELTERFRTKAHSLGLAQWQVDGLLAYDTERWEYIGNQIQARQAAEKYERQQVLAGKFGERTSRLQDAGRAVWERFGNGVWDGEAGSRAAKKLEDAGLWDDPDVVSSFANMYESMREANYLTNPSLPIGQPTVADLDRELAPLREKEFKGGLTDSEKARKQQIYQEKARLEARR